jgi:hypothetical protein
MELKTLADAHGIDFTVQAVDEGGVALAPEWTAGSAQGSGHSCGHGHWSRRC